MTLLRQMTGFDRLAAIARAAFENPVSEPAPPAEVARARAREITERIISTLERMGHCYRDREGRVQRVIVNVAETVQTHDGRTWLKFSVDMQRLPYGLRSVDLKTEATIIGLSDACQNLTNGAPIVLAQDGGVTYLTWLHKVDAKKPLPRLPKRVDFDLGNRPRGAYMLPLGHSAAGPIWKSACEVGHFLIGGTTRSGKSTLLHTLIASSVLCETPQTLQLALIDTKASELATWGGVPHLLQPVARDWAAAGALIQHMVEEMDRRGQLLGELPGARTFSKYNDIVKGQVGRQPLPLILMVVDEFVDLVLQARASGDRTLEGLLSRLASKGSGLGITLILTTTDPTADVVDMKIRRCCTYRMCFSVPTSSDSEIVLGARGAERIPYEAKGRMLLADESRRVVEIQGFFLSDEALKNISSHFPAPASTGVEVADSEASLEAVASKLDSITIALVQYADRHLAGEFAIGRLFEGFNASRTEQTRVPKHIIADIGSALAERELLITGPKPTNSRIRVRLVTDALRELCHADDAE